MSERLMAMIPTVGAAIVDPNAVKRRLKPFLTPKHRKYKVLPGLKDGNSFVVAVAGVSVAVIGMTFQIPAETTGEALRHEYIWQEAADVFSQAGGHFLLSIVEPETGPSKRMEQSQLLTAVTAAVLAAGDGRGVYWQSADYVIPPARFLDEAKQVVTSEFASALWFAFRFYPGSSDPSSNEIVCQSRGLKAFLGREVECGPYEMTPAEIARDVTVVARFMATMGPVFSDGDPLVVENSDIPHAQIVFDWSAVGGVNQPIFQLRLHALEESHA